MDFSRSNRCLKKPAFCLNGMTGMNMARSTRGLAAKGYVAAFGFCALQNALDSLTSPILNACCNERGPDEENGDASDDGREDALQHTWRHEGKGNRPPAADEKGTQNFAIGICKGYTFSPLQTAVHDQGRPWDSHELCWRRDGNSTCINFTEGGEHP